MAAVIYAMLTEQGTAAKETAVCTLCVATLLFNGRCLIPIPDDVVDTTLIDCSGNDELKCVICNHKEVMA